MKRQLLIYLLVIAVVFVASFAEAGPRGMPYGDLCGKCGKYGVCKDFISIEESSEAVKSYFSNSEIDVGTIRGKGRFLKIELLKGDRLYDIILFDRKTGRIRSIY